MSAEHAPTPQLRSHVEVLVASGIRQEHIAGILGISVPTLKKHYGEQLTLGKSRMLAKVAATLFQDAVGRAAIYDAKNNVVQSELKPNRASAMFIMKCQGGWKETNVVEISDPTAGARDRLAAAVDKLLATQQPEGDAAPEAVEATDRPRLN